MNDLIIEKSAKTPSIEFLSSGVLQIKGRSIPENPIEFYKNVFSWLDEYQLSSPKNADIHIDLEYYNTSTSIILLNIFRRLKHIKKSGCDVNFHWYSSCNDFEMMEAGKYYEKILRLPFQYH
jgi:hypothetical protein